MQKLLAAIMVVCLPACSSGQIQLNDYGREIKGPCHKWYDYGGPIAVNIATTALIMSQYDDGLGSTSSGSEHKPGSGPADDCILYEHVPADGPYEVTCVDWVRGVASPPQESNPELPYLAASAAVIGLTWYYRDYLMPDRPQSDCE